jgi:NDP-sugar pyrophosphorylase family protein
VGLGAVVTVGAGGWASDGAASSEIDTSSSVIVGPLECTEIAGRSFVERIVERFAAIDVDTVSIVIEDGTAMPSFRVARSGVTFEVTSDVRRSVREKLSEYSENGIQHAFVQQGDVYTETDLLDLFSFHREARQAVTATRDKEGPLALWVVNCEKAEKIRTGNLFQSREHNSASDYFIRQYVSRLCNPRVIRPFAADILSARCEARPSGTQVRPGVWIDESAEVHRRARIVAPAYIGRASTVEADVLITRCSNVERECCVDCGTVVEDSSILPATRVGVGLDLCHAVASGNRLFNLQRDVVVEISDAKVLRSTVPGRAAVQHKPPRREKKVKVKPDLGKLHPIDAWQFDNNLIQE